MSDLSHIDPTPQRWVTRAELADIMGVSRETVRQFVNDGMPSETWGLRCRRFYPPACIDWARRRAR